MHVVLWEFRVKTGRELEFERIYGPDGEWAQLFRHAQGYLGTELLRDENAPGRYITIDRWLSTAAFDAFKQHWGAEYQALDERCAPLSEREVALGSFSDPAPETRATSRPLWGQRR